MENRHIFMGVAVLCLLNGLFSPFVLLVAGAAPIWWPAFIPPTQALLLFASSVILSFATLLISGIPAAVYEKAVNRGHASAVSLFIWLGCAAILSLPALFTIPALL